MCFAYLDDLDIQPHMLQWVEEEGLAFDEWKWRGKMLFQTEFGRFSEWFQRAWTLQELIAPSNVIFFDRNWRQFGTRNSLAAALTDITSIDNSILKGWNTPQNFSVAQRMSWASMRIATRKEDETYSLIELFDVSLSMLYGEGSRAFLRLQKEIISQSPDQSIFAWTPENHEMNNTLLAQSPRDFTKSADIVPLPLIYKSYQLTNVGLEVELPRFSLPCPCVLNCWHREVQAVRLYCRSLDDTAAMIALLVRPLVLGPTKFFDAAVRSHLRNDRFLRISRSKIPQRYEMTRLTLSANDRAVLVERFGSESRFFRIQIHGPPLQIVSMYPSRQWNVPKESRSVAGDKTRIVGLELARIGLEYDVAKGAAAEGHVCFLYANRLQITLYISWAGIHLETSSKEDFVPHYPDRNMMKSRDDIIEVRDRGIRVFLSPATENILGVAERVHHLTVKDVEV